MKGWCGSVASKFLAEPSNCDFRETCVFIFLFTQDPSHAFIYMRETQALPLLSKKSRF